MNEYGIVGFFDILGYQNIIDNNDIEPVSKIISETLSQVPEQAKRGVRSLYSKERHKHINEQFGSRIDMKLISDSLLLSASLKGLDGNQRSELWWLFLLYVNYLSHEMFDNGLPVRGAIDVGDFYIDKQCFAGKPIINAYRLSESLDFSGAVLSDTARDEFLSRMANVEEVDDDTLHSIGFDFVVPLRDGSERRAFLLNWWVHREVPSDVAQLVFEAFRGHSKDIPRAAQRKLQNTELTLRALILNMREIVSKSTMAMPKDAPAG